MTKILATASVIIGFAVILATPWLPPMDHLGVQGAMLVVAGLITRAIVDVPSPGIRFSVRDLLWLIAIAALAIAWYLDHRSLRAALDWFNTTPIIG